MTRQSSPLRSVLASRSSIIAIVAAVSSFGAAPLAQASCDNALHVTAPVTITSPKDCVVVATHTGVNGDVINNTTIGPPDENDPAFLVGRGGILGALINNGIIQGGGHHLGGFDEDDFEDEEGYGQVGALTITSNVVMGVTNAGSILSGTGNAIQLGVGGDFDADVQHRPASMTGSIVNSGRINSDEGDGIAALFGTMSGALSNSSTGFIGGREAVHIASTFDSWTGGIFNSGVIDGDLSGIRIGDYDYGGEGDVVFDGGIHNLAGGLIIGRIDSAVRISGASFSGGITNAGTITEILPTTSEYDGVVAGDGIVITSHTFAGGITNTGLIEGLAGPAVWVKSSVYDFSGDIVNEGTITGYEDGLRIEANSVESNITNAGLIRGGNESSAVYLSINSFTGNVSNSGTLSGGAAGLGVNAESFHGDITNSSSGRMEGGSTGFYVNAGTFTGNISNGGTITGGYDGAYLDVGNFQGNISNSGLIQGGESSGAGVYLTGGTLTGNISNSGTIIGGVNGFHVSVDTFDGDFVNDGLIQGLGGFSDPGYYESAAVHYGDIINNGTLSALTNALWLQIGDLQGQVTNTGLIEATQAGGRAVLLDNGSATTFNNVGGGRIVGDILFSGKNANTFFGGDGSVAGNIEGSATYVPATNSFVNDDSIIVEGGVQTFTSQSGIGAGSASHFANFTVNNGGVAVLGSTSVGSSGGNGYNLTDVGRLTINSGGTLYVDNQSSLNVGTFSPQAGGTLQFLLSQPLSASGVPQNQYGTIQANGSIALAGNLQAVFSPGAFGTVGLNQYDFLGAITTNGTISGNFAGDSILNDLGFYQLSHTVNASSVDLHLTRIAFSAPDCSANGHSLGVLLEQLHNGGSLTPEQQQLFNALLSLPSDQICDVFDDLSGAKVADLGSVVVETAGPWKNLVNDRLNGLGSVGCNLAGEGGCLNRFASNDVATQTMTDATPGVDPFDWLKTGTRRVGATGTWGRLVGVWGGTDTKPGSNGTDFTLTGGILGVDHVFSEDLLAGGAIQITTDDIDFQNVLDNASVDSIEVGAYASYGDTRFYVNANTSFIWHDFKVRRNLDLGGAFASYNGTTASAYVEAGRIFEVDTLRIQPIVAASFAHLQTDSYAEHGGAPGLLLVDDADFTTFKSMVGGRFAMPFQLDSGRKIVPEARAVWAHEFADDHSAFWARLQEFGPSSAPFQVKGRSYPRDTAILGAGLTAPLSDEASITLDYDAAINPEMTTNTVSAGLRITW